MCGIAAIINPKDSDSTEIVALLARIRHRGDTEPTFARLGNSFLGSVRLKIVDCENGAQPFFSQDKTVGVVFNGEIYNYRDLKSELGTKGYQFSTDSDTEVLLHLYQEFGIDFIEKLDGMFAFVLVDSNRNLFYGVRDFFGVKPFYYSEVGSRILIASEMKSFLDIEVGEIKELLPGHYIAKDGLHKYYEIEIAERCDDSLAVAADRVRSLVENSIRKRVQTDLPIAVFLSGGVDSSIVQMLCAKYHSDVTALIVGEEWGEDVIYAKRLCSDFGYDFHHVRTDDKALVESIENVIFSIETFEPNCVRGSLLSMQLSELAHNLGFKIVLCGEGSDEIFGGYGDFLHLADEADYRSLSTDLFEDLYRTQLLRIDRTGMNYAVEIREPFLDRALVEYSLSLPLGLKVGPLGRKKVTTKLVLREAFKDILPSYVYARDKMTLMQGAGMGSVEKGKGILYEYSSRLVSDDEFALFRRQFPDYSLQDKEDALCFRQFHKYYFRAKFATTRVRNAQVEIEPNELNGY